MRSGSSSSSSRFKIRPKQVNASTCDFDRCCLQSGDNTGTHLHVSRKAICRPKQQLHVSTSMESPMSFVSRPWMFLIPSCHERGPISCVARSRTEKIQQVSNEQLSVKGGR